MRNCLTTSLIHIEYDASLISGETGFKNKRCMTDFRMAWLIIWAVLACYWISWPVHLKHMHLLHQHVLWKRKILEARWWTAWEMNQTRPLGDTAVKFWKATAEGRSWRPDSEEWRLALKAFHTHFALGEIYTYIMREMVAGPWTSQYHSP